jgi:hypothetical protein
MVTTPDVPGVERVRDQKRGYAQGEDRPLGSYLALMGVYSAAVGAAGAGAAVLGKDLPERVEPWDVALISVATHKLSRLISKDSVASPLRAPFARYKGVSGPSELNEEVRGTGMRKAVGELVTCPFCLGMWIATGFAAGLVFAPRFTRLTAATLTSLAASDFLHFAYAKTYQTVE